MSEHYNSIVSETGKIHGWMTKFIVRTLKTRGVEMFFSAIKLARITLLALLAAGLTACAVWNQGGNAVRLYVLDCGDIEVLDLAVFQPGLPRGVKKDLAVSCYLVVHPQKGILLYDTGVGDLYVDKGKTLIQGFANFSLKRKLFDQLQEIGIRPEMVNYIAMSHLHLDHTGNSALFPHALHLIQAEEYAAAFESPNDEQLVGDRQLVQSLRRNTTKKLTSDFDVFGDGSAILKRTPGHTPGHQSLLVKLEKSGFIFLSGDLVHYIDNWISGVVPGFNVDQEKSLRSISAIRRFLLFNDARLWIGHDSGQSANIKHSPAFYD